MSEITSIDQIKQWIEAADKDDRRFSFSIDFSQLEEVSTMLCAIKRSWSLQPITGPGDDGLDIEAFRIIIEG